MQRTAKFRRGALMKAVLLLIFIVAAVATVRLPASGNFSPWKSWGPCWRPRNMGTPGLYAGLCCRGLPVVPGTLLTALGAAIFGPYRGFLYVWVGAMLGPAARSGSGGPGAGVRRLPHRRSAQEIR